MKKYFIIIFIFIFIQNPIVAQLNNHWAFAPGKGLCFNHGDSASWEQSNAYNYTDEFNKFFISTDICSYSTVSDCEGNRLFYTTSRFVFNKYNELIDSLKLKEVFGMNVWERNKNIVIPHPKNKNQYFIFYSCTPDSLVDSYFQQPYKKKIQNAYMYVVIDLSLKNGHGGFVKRPTIFNKVAIGSSNITFAKHANNRDFWILFSENLDTLDAYLVDSNGLNPVPIKSPVKTMVPIYYSDVLKINNPLLTDVARFVDGSFFSSGSITMNHQYNKLFTCGREFIYEKEHIWMYDFNRSTGKCTNPKAIFSRMLPTVNGRRAYITRNIVVAPNDSFIYASVIQVNGLFDSTLPQLFLFQVDLNNFKYQAIYEKKNWNKWYKYDLGLAIGGDQKLYIFDSHDIFRVPNPNLSNCGWETFYHVKTFGGSDQEAFNFMRYPQGAYELSNRIFLPRKPKLQETCVDTSFFYFSGDTLAQKLKWEFGDGDSFIQKKPIPWTLPIKHRYKQNGKFQVKLSAYFEECNITKVVKDTLKVSLQSKINQIVVSHHPSCAFDSIKFVADVLYSDTLEIILNDSVKYKFQPDSLGKFQGYFPLYDTLKKKIFWKFKTKFGCNVITTDSISAKIFSSVNLNWSIQNPNLSKFGTMLKIESCVPYRIELIDSSINRIQTLIWKRNSLPLKFPNYQFGLSILDSQKNALYYIQSMSKNGCFALDSFIVTGFENPKMGFAVLEQKSCLKDNFLQLKDSFLESNSKLEINWGDNSKSIVDSAIFMHRFKDTGTFNYQLIKTTVKGCTDTVLGSTHVFANPAITATLNCIDSCERSNRYELIDYSGSRIVINWRDGAIDSGTNQSFNHHYKNGGQYSPIILFENKHQCIDSLNNYQVKILKNAQLNSRLFKDTICFGNEMRVHFSEKIFIENDIEKYKRNIWLNGQLEKLNVDSNVSISCNLAGTNLIRTILVAPSGCNDTVTQSFHVRNSMNLKSVGHSICENDTLKFVVNWDLKLKNIELEYKINDSIQNILNPTPPIFANYTSFKPGKYQFKVHLRNDLQCEEFDSLYVNVMPIPQAKFNYSVIGYTDKVEQLQLVDQTMNSIGWNWDFGVFGNSSSPDPLIQVPSNSKVNAKLWVVDGNGCKDSVSEIILVFRQIKFSFPTAISVNKDGLNDVFKSEEQIFIKKLTVSIFNSWGGKVFESNDRNFEWKPEILGNYVYVIHIDDIAKQKHIINGTLQVLK